MPIKPENKSLYPANWAEIRSRIRERAGDKCENCGVVNHSWINRLTREMCISDEYDAIRVICTTAHLDHDPRNCNNNNLKFLCQRCHNRYDINHRKETRRNTRMKDQMELDFRDPYMITISYPEGDFIRITKY